MACSTAGVDSTRLGTRLSKDTIWLASTPSANSSACVAMRNCVPQLLRLALEIVEDLALQIHVQMCVGLVEKNRRRSVSEQKGQQGQRLMETAAAEMMSYSRPPCEYSTEM